MSTLNEIDDFQEWLVGNSPVRLEATKYENENKNWTVLSTVYGKDFTIVGKLEVAKGKVGETKCDEIIKSINGYGQKLEILKDALELCIPDSIEFESADLEDWQKDTLKKAKEILNENSK